MGSVAPQHVGSSQTSDQTQCSVPCIARQILNHWTTRETPTFVIFCFFFKQPSWRVWSGVSLRFWFAFPSWLVILGNFHVLMAIHVLCLQKCLFKFLVLFFFLAVLHNIQDCSSLNRDQTSTTCSRRVQCWLLVYQGSSFCLFLNWVICLWLLSCRSSLYVPDTLLLFKN